MTRGIEQRFDETPVTWIVLLAYITLAVLTGGLDPTTAALVEHGAAVGMLIPDEPWRLVSYAFLHGGLVHIGFNSYFLVFLGPQLERALGSVRFAILHVVAALGGGLAGAVWGEPVAPLVGGSGSLFGMMGAIVALMMRRGRTQLEFLEHHGARNILVLIAANLVLGWLIPMVSNAAHIGGLIAGFVATYMFLVRGRAPTDGVTRVAQAGWVALLVVVTVWVMHPVGRWDWNLRGAYTAPTAELRQQHADAFVHAGMPNESFEYLTGMAFRIDPGPTVHVPRAELESLMRAHLPKFWGEPGRRLVERWFD